MLSSKVLGTCNTTSDLRNRADRLRGVDWPKVARGKGKLHEGTYPSDQAIESLVNEMDSALVVALYDTALDRR